MHELHLRIDVSRRKPEITVYINPNGFGVSSSNVFELGETSKRRRFVISNISKKRYVIRYTHKNYAQTILSELKKTIPSIVEKKQMDVYYVTMSHKEHINIFHKIINRLLTYEHGTISIKRSLAQIQSLLPTYSTN